MTLLSLKAQSTEYTVRSVCIDTVGAKVSNPGDFYMILTAHSLKGDLDTLTIGYDSGVKKFGVDSSTVPDSLIFGPFPHSGSGGNFEEITVEIRSAGRKDTLLISEALCGYSSSNGLNREGFICNDSRIDIVACASPPRTVTSGELTYLNMYVLVDKSTQKILAVNKTGLFEGVPNLAKLEIWAFTAPSSEEALFFSEFLVGDIIMLPGYTGCFAYCGTQTFETECFDFDLALRKAVKGNMNIKWGDTVSFEITVFNQGNMDAQNIELTDYIPKGFELIDNSYPWNLVDPSRATFIITDTLAAWDSVKLSVDMKVKEGAALTDLTNTVEISYAENILGTVPDDEDSFADGINNETDVIDDAIDDTLDEDDHDIAVPQVFDLALRKRVFDSGESIGRGDTVEFMIEIFNQGNTGATNIEVADFYLEGFLFPVDANPNWKIIGDHLESNLQLNLAAGEVDTLFIKLVIDSDASPVNLLNFAEIIGADDADGNNANDSDIDSSPDDNINNDIGAFPGSPTDDQIDDNGLLDEDDHDVALLAFCPDFACKGAVNVSLGEDCILDLTPIMFLTDTAFSADAYEIIVIDEAGDTIDNKIDESQLGQSFDVIIRYAGNACPDVICWTTMIAEDKLPPSIACGNDTVFCNETLDLVGLIPTGGCNNPEIQIVRNDFVEICDNDSITGKYIRTYKYVDRSGNESEPCTSEIFIKVPLLSDIEMPKDTLIDCSLYNDGDFLAQLATVSRPSLWGQPWSMGSFEGCSIEIFYEDQILLNTSCKKVILRMWEARKWTCGGKDEKKVYPQKITVLDTTAPEISLIGDTLNFSVTQEDCHAQITINDLLTVTDQCTDDTMVEIFSEFGIAADNSGQTLKLPYGLNKVFISATDQCHNHSIDSIWALVYDNTPPLIVCHSNTVVDMSSTIQVDVDADVFNIAVLDYCSNVELLVRKMEITCDGSDTVLANTVRFCCEDIGNEVMVLLRAIDTSGNYSECMVSASVTGDTTQCPDQLMKSISGDVRSIFYDQPLPGVEMILSNDQNESMGDEKTDGNGYYMFDAITEGGNYSMKPYKNDDWMNGVSTLDLITIQNHLLMRQPIQKPELLLAADINRDGYISAIDLVLLRRLILGYSSVIANNTSWRFIWNKKNEEMSIPQMEQYEKYDVRPLINDMIVDWVGIKVGDITGNSLPENVILTESRNSQKHTFKYDLTQNDDQYKMDVYSSMEVSISGFQINLALPRGGQFTGIDDGQLNIPGIHVRVSEDELRISHNMDSAQQINADEPLFTVYLDRISADEMIMVKDDLFASEIYTPDGVSHLNLLKSHADNQDKLILFQNTPNPWVESTSLKFYIPKSGTYNIQVYDILNRGIFNWSREYGEGEHQEVIKAVDLPGNGVFIVEISDEDGEKDEIYMLKVD